MTDNKIKRCDAAYQGSKPICGIYAFINGLLYKDAKSFDKNKADEVASDIWNIIIHDDYKSNKYSAKNGVGMYSAIGEFFSSQNLIDFLNQNYHKIKDIFEEKGFRNIDYCIAGKYEDFPNDITSNPNSFYLIPINSFKDSCWNKANRYNMHWICVKSDGKHIIIINSDKKYSSEKRALKKLKGKCKIKLKNKNKISTVDDFKAVYNDMYHREDDKEHPFHFRCWALNNGISSAWHCSDKKEYLSNLCRIIKTGYTSNFKKKGLSAIRIDILGNSVESERHVMAKRGIDFGLSETVHSTFSLMGYFGKSPKTKDILEGSTGTLNYHDGLAEVEMTPIIDYQVGNAGAHIDVENEDDSTLYGCLEDGTYVRFNSFSLTYDINHAPGFPVAKYIANDLDFSKDEFSSDSQLTYDHLLVTYDSLNEYGAFVTPNLMEKNVIENPPVFIGGDENFDVYLTCEWKRYGNRINVNVKAQVELEIRIKGQNTKVELLSRISEPSCQL